jgi:hypothetical protein
VSIGDKEVPSGRGQITDFSTFLGHRLKSVVAGEKRKWLTNNGVKMVRASTNEKYCLE